jgi:hypothetical protein
MKDSKRQLREYLLSINGDCNVEIPSWLEVCHNAVVREKAIYTIINQLQKRSESNNYIGFLWAPSLLEGQIKDSLAMFQTTEF